VIFHERKPFMLVSSCSNLPTLFESSLSRACCARMVASRSSDIASRSLSVASRSANVAVGLFGSGGLKTHVAPSAVSGAIARLGDLVNVGPHHHFAFLIFRVSDEEV
jgi:hypothetical protein